MAVSREELYDQIWEKPITKVAQSHAVSDSFLIRILKRLNIPRPPAGYWAKLAAGKSLPKRPSLPKILPGDEAEWYREFESAAREPFVLPEQNKTESTESTSNKRVKTSQHPLLKESRQYFKNVSESETGHLKPIKKNLPDIIVTNAILDRTFKLANDFFTLLHSKGHRVLLAPPSLHLPRPNVILDESGKEYPQYPGIWSPGKPTLIYVSNIPLGLTIFESTTRIRGRNVNGHFVPTRIAETEPQNWKSPHDFTYEKNYSTGRLCFRIYAPHPLTTWSKQWSEEKGKPIKDVFNLIISNLIDCAQHVARLITEAETEYDKARQKWEVDTEKRKAEQSDKQRQQALQDSNNDLLAIIDAWSEAHMIKDFFHFLESQSGELPSPIRSQILSRIETAKSQISDADILRQFLDWKSADERINCAR